MSECSPNNVRGLVEWLQQSPQLFDLDPVDGNRYYVDHVKCRVFACAHVAHPTSSSGVLLFFAQRRDQRMMCLTDNSIWLGHSGGLIRLDPASNTPTSFSFVVNATLPSQVKFAIGPTMRAPTSVPAATSMAALQPGTINAAISTASSQPVLNVQTSTAHACDNMAHSQLSMIHVPGLLAPPSPTTANPSNCMANMAVSRPRTPPPSTSTAPPPVGVALPSSTMTGAPTSIAHSQPNVPDSPTGTLTPHEVNVTAESARATRATLNAALKQDVEAVRKSVTLQINQLRKKHDISFARARQLVSSGINSVDIRRTSKCNLWRSWIAHRPQESTLQRRADETLNDFNKRLGKVWRSMRPSSSDQASVKEAKAKKLQRTMRKVDRWAKSRPTKLNQVRLRAAMDRTASKLTKLLNNALDLSNIRIVAFMAPPDAMTLPHIVGKHSVTELFAQALHATRHDLRLDAVGQTFWAHCIASPVDADGDERATRTAQPPVATILESLNKRTNPTWKHQRSALAVKLIDIIYAAVKKQAELFQQVATDPDEEAKRVELRSLYRRFLSRSKTGAEMYYTDVFNDVQKFGLHICGWPLEGEALLLHDDASRAIYQVQPDQTLTIVSGSLPNKNVWSRSAGRYVLAVLTASPQAISCIPVGTSPSTSAPRRHSVADVAAQDPPRRRASAASDDHRTIDAADREDNDVLSDSSHASSIGSHDYAVDDLSDTDIDNICDLDELPSISDLAAAHRTTTALPARSFSPLESADDDDSFSEG